MKHRNLCGTRPWFPSGGRGELTHHAPDDHHEGGAKSGRRGALRFGSVVPHRTVAQGGRLHCVRSGTNRQGNPCTLGSFNRIRRTVRSMKTELRRTCPSCGNEFSGAMEFCPVCMLRKGLAGGAESGGSSASEDTVTVSNLSNHFLWVRFQKALLHPRIRGSWRFGERSCKTNKFSRY